MVNRWNKLDEDTVDCESVNGFKNRLEKWRDMKMGFFMDKVHQALRPHWIWSSLILVWPHQVNDQVNDNLTTSKASYNVNYSNHRLFTG